MNPDPANLSGSAAPGVYLFCFACPAAIPAVGGPGLDDVGVVSCEIAGDVVAVVSSVNVEEYCGPTSEANLRNLAWIAPRAFHHEMVIERVMHGSPVLPVRFGTIFSSSESLAGFLARNHLAITRFLKSVTGKDEWAVKVFLERSKAEKRLIEADDRFLKVSPSQGTRYMQLRRLRAEAGKEVTLWAKTVMQDLGKELEREEADMRSVKPRALDPREMPLERIACWAFLLRRETVEHFRRRVEQSGARYREWGVHLDLSGPWPPYSFCPSLGNDERSHLSGSETPD
ncbi:MAG: GvpL/GvpF family gas vesicle protein [Deltaproteobacteria bacterium]|nr:GvpL/GvpF family gas vesicle protein [Deltaproteobacteria bacterium]